MELLSTLYSVSCSANDGSLLIFDVASHSDASYFGKSWQPTANYSDYHQAVTPTIDDTDIVLNVNDLKLDEGDLFFSEFEECVVKTYHDQNFGQVENDQQTSLFEVPPAFNLVDITELLSMNEKSADSQLLLPCDECLFDVSQIDQVVETTLL